MNIFGHGMAVLGITVFGGIGLFVAKGIAISLGVSLFAGLGILGGGIIGAVAVIGGLAIGIRAIVKVIANKIRKNKAEKAIDKSKEVEKIYYGIIERIAHNDPLFSLVIMYLTCLLISSDYYFIKIPAGILSWFEGIQSTKKMARGFINNKFIKNEIDELDKSIENIMKKSNREVNRNIDKNELRQLILLQNFDNLKNENIAEQRENDESENIPMQKRDEDVLNLVS